MVSRVNDFLPMFSSNPRLRSPVTTSGGPFSRARSHSPSKHFRLSTRPRKLINILKFLIPAAFLLILLGLYTYEPHIEIQFYDRGWIYRQIQTVTPLAGCFDPQRVSPHYNLSASVFGPRQTEIQAGMALRTGLDCYELAGTIQSRRQYDTAYVPPDQRNQYHTYWRADLAGFHSRQEWMLKAFFATQNLKRSRLILWTNHQKLGDNEFIQNYLRQYPESFILKVVDKQALAKGTYLEGSNMLDINDERAWVDGDLIRLLVLWTYGGVWVDMDMMLTRDLEPLFEHEFVTQWDCYDKPYTPMNGALMRFHQHSPYLCEAFHIMASSPKPRRSSTDWGSVLYFKLWRSLVASGVPPFKILPFCFSDGRACRLDNRLPHPFQPDDPSGMWTMGLGLEEGGALDRVLSKIFAVHLHNQWDKEFPRGGWVDRLLLRRYEEKLGRTLS